MKAEPKTETHQDTAGVADAHAGQQGRALALGAPDDAVGSGQGVLAHFWFVPASVGKRKDLFRVLRMLYEQSCLRDEKGA